MGNQPAEKDQFTAIVSQMRKSKLRKQSVSVHPEKKYLAQMVVVLEASELPTQLKYNVLKLLEEGISSEELIETVSAFSKLKDSHSVFVPAEKSTINEPVSKNVFVNFLSKPNPRMSQRQEQPSSSKKILDSEETIERVRKMKATIRKEIFKIYHPFWKLCKVFAQYIENGVEETFPVSPDPEDYEKALNKLLVQWCTYILEGCLLPYKKWICEFTRLGEGKYKKVMVRVLMEDIWDVNDHYLFLMLKEVINRRKVPLKIVPEHLQHCSQAITPSLFKIDSQLAIEGHFFDGIYQMAGLTEQMNPASNLAQLLTVKSSICNDVDKYHRLADQKEIYEIDSDNIMGIVNYILCKIPSKIDDLYTQLLFLRIIYGDSVYYTLDVSSYMLSTIFGSLEFLESEEFLVMLQLSCREKKLELFEPDRMFLGSKLTNCSTSASKQEADKEAV